MASSPCLVHIECDSAEPVDESVISRPGNSLGRTAMSGLPFFDELAAALLVNPGSSLVQNTTSDDAKPDGQQMLLAGWHRAVGSGDDENAAVHLCCAVIIVS